MLTTVAWIGGLIVALLALAGLQRKFFPHTIANGFMDLDKLKDICPELFKKK
jgi:hypothetical protein